MNKLKFLLLVVIILLIYTHPCLSTTTHVVKNLIEQHKSAFVGITYDPNINPLTLLENYFIKKIFVIDPYNQFRQNTLCDKHRLSLIHLSIKEAAICFNPDLLDFIYIFDKSNVQEYLYIWWNSIKPGGILAGNMHKKTNFINEIQQFCTQKNIMYHTQDEQIWWLQKPHILSFIIPTYNRAHVICDAIDSIYNQKNLTVDFEVIVTDDGSTDNTLKLLEKYAQKYSNFHYYQHAQNQGASETRNTCIAHAKGDLIFNLDSDNILAPDSIQSLITHMDQTNADIVAFEHLIFFTQKNKEINRWTFATDKEFLDFTRAFSPESPLASGNYLFTKRSFDRAGTYQGRYVETWRFGFRQMAHGAKVAILPDSFYWHRKSKDSNWEKGQKRNRNDTEMLRELRNHPELFSDNANSIFEAYTHRKENGIFADIRNKKFCLIPDKALEHLFDAYTYEQHHLYTEALKEYHIAIEYGCNVKHLESRIQKIECLF
ncbi:MAG TPA: glycosyltransferase [Candidatus Dependentiae bacterium]|nr:glycosyltransferase [Candidatus Dependentiae bacterium]HRQ63110.1 glycosyltransferase [Candidatus Dependentiae bacterium]